MELSNVGVITNPDAVMVLAILTSETPFAPAEPRAEVLDQPRRDRAQLVVAQAREQVRAPHLQVAPTGVLGQVRIAYRGHQSSAMNSDSVIRERITVGASAPS